METKDKWDIIVSIFWLLVIAFIMGSIIYNMGYDKGYDKGYELYQYCYNALSSSR